MELVEKEAQYKGWMVNLSFFSDNSFVLDNIEILYDLINYIARSYENYIHINKTDIDYTKFTLEDNLPLVQEFFNRHGFNLNLDKMIKNGNIIFDHFDKKRDYYGAKTDGSSYYGADNKKIVSINVNSSLYDGIVLTHEIMHYLNQPDDKRGIVSDLLTEACSFASELVFCDEIKDMGYVNDYKLCLLYIMNTIYKMAIDINPIYKIIYLYKMSGKINSCAYDKIFNDGKYSIVMDRFNEYTDLRCNVFRDTWYIIGIPIAIYLYLETKHDKSNFKYIKILNDNLNQKGFFECLSLIDMSDYRKKIELSTLEFLKVLDDIYQKDDVIRKKKLVRD